MKKDELLNKIRTTALDEMPDVMSKIDLNKIQIEEKPEKVRSGFNFKRALTLSMSVFVIAISAFLFYNYVYTPNTPDLTPLSGESEIIGFQTVSAASMLNLTQISPLSYEEPVQNYLIPLSATTTAITTATPSTDLANQMTLINGYMNMMETVIGDQNQMMYQSVSSDNPDYQYALEFKSTDLNGNLIQYKIYYNMMLNGNIYDIEGIMLSNEKQFSFSGQVNSENKTTNEQFTAYIDANNYVQVRNLSTNQNQVFAYKIVKDNQIYNESTVSLKSLQYSIQASVQTKHNNEDLTLTIQRDKTNNENTIQVSYNIKNQGIEKAGQFQVGLQENQSTGKYVYAYHFNDSQQVTTKERNGKGNTPAKPEDFKDNMRNYHNSNKTKTTMASTQITTDEVTTYGIQTNNGNSTNDQNAGNTNSKSNDARNGSGSTASPNGNGATNQGGIDSQYRNKTGFSGQVTINLDILNYFSI